MLIGIVLFAGLPLFGWGLRDLGGFFRGTPRLAYIAVVLVLQIAVVSVYPAVGRTGAEGKEVPVKDRLALLPLQLIPLAIVILAPFGDRRGIAAVTESTVLRYLGLALFALGFLGMQWAEVTLARQFSIYVKLQKGHRLITKGLYRYIRHPRYLGITIFAAGVSLVFRSWLGLLLAAALLITLLLRIRSEEAMLRREFGPEWEAYAAGSWRLVPFIY